MGRTMEKLGSNMHDLKKLRKWYESHKHTAGEAIVGMSTFGELLTLAENLKKERDAAQKQYERLNQAILDTQNTVAIARINHRERELEEAQRGKDR